MSNLHFSICNFQFAILLFFASAVSLRADGVAVPVVRHLARHLFEPLIAEPVAASLFHAPAAPV